MNDPSTIDGFDYEGSLPTITYLDPLLEEELDEIGGFYADMDEDPRVGSMVLEAIDALELKPSEHKKAVSYMRDIWGYPIK